MPVSLGNNCCSNDITHETCVSCGTCSSCNEIHLDELFSAEDVMELFDATLNQIQELNSVSEFRSHLLNSLNKKSRLATNFLNMPIVQLSKWFPLFVKSNISEIEDFLLPCGSYADFDTAFRHYLITKLKANIETVESAYYVDDPDFAFNLEKQDNDALFEGVILIFHKLNIHKSELLEDFSKYCPENITLTIESFNDYYVNNKEG